MIVGFYWTFICLDTSKIKDLNATTDKLYRVKEGRLINNLNAELKETGWNNVPNKQYNPLIQPGIVLNMKLLNYFKKKLTYTTSVWDSEMGAMIMTIYDYGYHSQLEIVYFDAKTNKSERYQYSLSSFDLPSDWENIQFLNANYHLEREGLEQKISDTWFESTDLAQRYVYFKIDDQDIWGEFTLAYHTSIESAFTLANFSDDKRYWSRSSEFKDLKTEATGGSSSIKLDFNKKRSSGEFGMTDGMYPYKNSLNSVNIYGFNKIGEFISIKSWDKMHNSSNQTWPMDYLFIDGRAYPIEPLEFQYDENGSITGLITHNYNRFTTKRANLRMTILDSHEQSSNYLFFRYSKKEFITKWEGHIYDSNGQKHELKSAIGLYTSVYEHS